jgi:surfeit locus 1 family protein
MKINLGCHTCYLAIFPALAFLSLLALLISLGFWQLDRAQGKKELQELNNIRAEGQVLTLSVSTPENIDGLRYRKVVLSGRYDEEHQFLIDNQIANGKPGYYVATPLQLSGSNKTVLVNRGWVPLNKNRSILPDISFNNTENVSLTGRINKFPSVGLKLKGADIPTLGWPAVVQVIDKQILSERLGYPLFGFQVELDANMDNGYYRKWHEVKLLSPEKHTAYAVQWFALAVTLCGLFFWYGCKKESNE